MKSYLINFIIIVSLLLIACQSRRVQEEKLILKPVIQEFARFHQEEIDQGKNILLISKGKISNSVKEQVEWHDYKSGEYADWEALIDNLIQGQCGETDSINLFNLSDSKIVLKAEFNQADSAYIFGALGVSNICFSSEYTKAIIYVDFVCGGECGFSSIYFLRKENEEWHYVGELGLGVS